MPGTVFVALGLYGKFWSEGDSFFRFLNDQNNANLILIIGIIIWFYCWSELIKLLIKKVDF